MHEPGVGGFQDQSGGGLPRDKRENKYEFPWEDYLAGAKLIAFLQPLVQERFHGWLPLDRGSHLWAGEAKGKWIGSQREAGLRVWGSLKLTCRARILLMVSGSECGCASTLEMTGILGVTISVTANAASSLETAGSMKLVWKAPATARRTCKFKLLRVFFSLEFLLSLG